MNANSKNGIRVTDKLNKKSAPKRDVLIFFAVTELQKGQAKIETDIIDIASKKSIFFIR